MDQEQKQRDQETHLLLDFKTLKAVSVLGRGAKGVAFLVKNGEDMLALKAIHKSSIEKKKKIIKDDSNVHDEVDYYKRIWFERDVLKTFHHPLLPKLRGVVFTDEIIGFGLDYCSGGDLNSLRKQQTEKMFSDEIIRFYAAELVLVLEYLHKLGIIYRDLKPENILIQANGHLMIVDFDLSTKLSSKSTVSNQSRSAEIVLKRKKSRIQRFLPCNSGISQVDSVATNVNSESESVQKSNSFVGTEEYVAPEIILGNGHDFSVDWWSLGVVLYEMLYGRTPFRGSNRKETFYRILSKSTELVGEQTDLRDLIGKLLEKDPAKRISVDEIKAHSYFKTLNWDSILHISRPPYIPPVRLDDGNDLEGVDGIDVELIVKGIFDKNELEKEKNAAVSQKNNLVDESNKSVWVDGLNNPSKDADFLIF
ncbi:hypothetical protein IFM89_017542 [Coptis chinensis]|uniref:non-specific serine/threonine protein kinase n=1 Tax=Coptis chinensis TaxID=261450 RepID=A0A835HWA1_9MAGN|nr:hypothetical protein IFM89_017542 [Coptis chinensis]